MPWNNSKNKQKKKVLVAMSGGIDSSVATILLKEKGYDIVGVTFRVFDSMSEACLKKEKGCCTIDSIMEAKHFAQQLNIEHYVVDYRADFRKLVIQNFVDEYKQGRTPNPCVLCNFHIKWGKLFDLADELGCSHVATGHYARIITQPTGSYLRTAADKIKDQTYFLWMIPKDKLERTIFPLGDFTKNQVRDLAQQYGFTSLSKKRESQEICFVPNNDYRTFIKEAGCPMQSGEFVNPQGNVIGKHNGYQQFTIGQRKGLGIALGHPLYVKEIDPTQKSVVLGEHDELYTQKIFISGLCLTHSEDRNQLSNVSIRIRYRSEPVRCKINDVTNNNAVVETEVPVWAVTPGQSAVFYKNELLLGGGIIAPHQSL